MDTQVKTGNNEQMTVTRAFAISDQLRALQKGMNRKNRKIARLQEENQRLQEILSTISGLGHSTHHGKGYTLADIAESALK